MFSLLQVDHWLEFSTTRLSCASDFSDALQYLDQVLGPVTYLVGHSVTLADCSVWATLRGRLCIVENKISEALNSSSETSLDCYHSKDS